VSHYALFAKLHCLLSFLYAVITFRTFKLTTKHLHNLKRHFRNLLHCIAREVYFHLKQAAKFLDDTAETFSKL